MLLRFSGNSIYAFSTMLTAFLVGIAIGSLVASRLVIRRKRLVMALGLLQAAIGSYVLLCLYLFAWFAEPLRQLQAPLPDWNQTAERFLEAFGLMCIPTILMGAAFPVASASIFEVFRDWAGGWASCTVGTQSARFVGAGLDGLRLDAALGPTRRDGGASLPECDDRHRTLPGRSRREADTKSFLAGALVVTSGIALAAMPESVFRSRPSRLPTKKSCIGKTMPMQPSSFTSRKATDD